MDDQQLVNAACPHVADLGGAFYFAPATLARGKELGVDGFRFYFVGRGGVLGDVEAPVVTSAFGYFEAKLVKTIWDSGCEKLAPRDGGRAYAECSRQFGRDHFAGLPDAEAFCSAAEAVVRAAHPAAMPLFAGTAAEPLPGDAPGRAMQLVTTLRELRGGAHLIAVLASGLTPKVAHYLRRPEYFETFGYSVDETPEVGDADRQMLAAAEQLTDRLVARAYGVLDQDQRRVLVAGLEWMRGAVPAS